MAAVQRGGRMASDRDRRFVASETVQTCRKDLTTPEGAAAADTHTE
jgi:hypothetical protein